nr:phage tail tape measure protein [Streptomyces sp. SID4926]
MALAPRPHVGPHERRVADRTALPTARTPAEGVQPPEVTVSLTIGELTGLISLDDRGVAPALRRTENAMRSTGRQMAGDADEAGQRAGQALGDAVTEGADGRLRNARGRFVAAGRRIGSDVGDGAADGAEEGGDRAAGRLSGALSRVKGLVIGGAIGAALVTGLSESMEQGQIAGRMGAQLGTTPAVAQQYGRIAGQLYAKGVTEDFQTAADAISATMRAGIAPPGATNAQLESIATKVADLAQTFELDLGQTANAVGQMIKTGLAKNGTEALDALTAGLQKMGPRADDIADTFNEYSTIFRAMGLSASQATGLLSQGMKAGARDTDVVADAIKEFQIRATDGSTTSAAGFKALGLSAKDMTAQIAKGGKGASDGLQTVLDKLRNMKDPVDRNAAAVALFGTKAEDMGKALFELDPSKAVSDLGQVGGAADRMGNTLRDNAGAQLTAFQRGLKQKLVDVLGGEVIPAFTRAYGFIQKHSTVFKVVAGVVTAVLVPALVLMGVTATVSGARTAAGWVRSGASATRSAAVQVAAAARTTVAWLGMAAQGTAAFVRMAAAAVANAARTAAVWAASAARMTATWLVSILRVAATTVAQFVLMAARAVAWAAVMAAQWLIAMGPVGWITAAVIALVVLIIAKWDTIKAATLAAWNWIWAKVQWAANALVQIFLNFTLPGLIIKHWDSIKSGAVAAWNAIVGWLKGVPGMIYNAFLNFTPIGLMIKHWNTIKTNTISRAQALVSWMRGLPGRISGALGNMGSLLVSKGRAVVQGLWNGIQSMGGWLSGKLVSFAKSAIPGPIAKALGIHSPSRLMASAIGRHIPSGIAMGAEDNVGVLDRTMQNLVSTPRPGVPGVSAGGGVSGRSGSASGSAVPALQIRSDGTRIGDLLVEVLRQSVTVRGGNVQTVLGRG